MTNSYLLIVAVLVVLPVALIVGTVHVIALFNARERRRSAKRSRNGPYEPGPDPCPACGYDVRGGFDPCPECGRPTGSDHRRRLTALRDAVPSLVIDARPPAADEVRCVAFETPDEPLAQLLRDHLEVRGFDVEHGPAAHRWRPTDYRLLVWSADLPAATDWVSQLWPSTTMGPRADDAVGDLSGERAEADRSPTTAAHDVGRALPANGSPVGRRPS